jgi:phage tail-like protein
VEGLKQPVDIAVAPSGAIYVADEKAGEISVWSSRFERIASFKAITPGGLPANPDPIAVFVEADGSIGVVDASHPRILQFAADGTAIGDVEWRTLAANLPDAPLALAALRCIYGPAPFHIIAGACLGPCPLPDGAVRLALAHRNLRLIGLTLAQQFATSGTFVSAALDGGIPGTAWHKVVIHAEVPPGTWLEVQAVTADDPTWLNDPNALPAGTVFRPSPGVPDADGSPRLPDGVRDALILSPPGRYARVRVTLGGDGTATPSVRLIQVFSPRVSYLELLPRVFQRDTDAERFLERFLALFEYELTGAESRYEDFSRQLDLDAARPDILAWLGALIDVAFEPSWLPARRRTLLREAVRLYQVRGTPAGISRYLEIYTGRAPILVEHWLEMDAETPGLGRAGSILGLGSLVAPARGSDVDRAHRFSVYVESDDSSLDETLSAMARRIVDTAKPAHTSYDLYLLRPGDGVVGEGRVGFDVLLTGRETPRLELGGCAPKSDGPPPGSTLGVNAVLGPPRPEFSGPFGLTL